MRLEAIAGAAKGVSRAVERLSRAVERASRVAGTFSRVDKRARKLAVKESWAVEETFMSARIMGETAEVPQWVEGSIRGTARQLPECAN